MSDKALAPAAPHLAALELYQRYGGQGHLLAPATDRFTTGSEVVVPHATQLIIDPNPKGGEVHIIGGKCALSRVALDRIAQAAGVTWEPAKCGATTLDRDYIVYQVVGYIRKPDGTLDTITGTKEIDMAVIEEESRMLQARKLLDDKTADYSDLDEGQRTLVDKKVRAEVLEFRKHRLARAETGAKNRAVRSLGLKGVYPPQELQKPFVVIRWGLNPEHPYALAERRALFDHQAPALPSNPLPEAPEPLDVAGDLGGLGLVEAEGDDEEGAVFDAEEEGAQILDLLDSPLFDDDERQQALARVQAIEQDGAALAALKAELADRLEQATAAQTQ